MRNRKGTKPLNQKMKCKYCGKEFKQNSGVQIFCSRKCTLKYQSIKNKKEWIYTVRGIKRKCVVCGKEYIIKCHNSKYCCKNCYRIGHCITSKKWGEENKDRKVKNVKKWTEENKKHISEYARKRRLKNRDKINKQKMTTYYKTTIIICGKTFYLNTCDEIEKPLVKKMIEIRNIAKQRKDLLKKLNKGE